MESLIEALRNGKGLDEHHRKQLALFPECLIGCPPGHLAEMIERLDCPTCQQILALVEQGEQGIAELKQRIRELCKPVSDRNARRREVYATWGEVPIIGMFVPRPKIESEPDYASEAWFQEERLRLEKLGEGFDPLCAQDPKHWGDATGKAIGNDLIRRFLLKDAGIVVMMVG